jgi:hypothetical protein
MPNSLKICQLTDFSELKKTSNKLQLFQSTHNTFKTLTA